jgi:hypothetical protein
MLRLLTAAAVAAVFTVVVVVGVHAPATIDQ